MQRPITILECTLRDGSYLIDYQFTAEDTYVICTGLEQAGFKYIEIGHGTGLHSSKAGKGIAAATDEEYLEAAYHALRGTQAKFGMFFIPGIGKCEDLKIAESYGMGFVRIGTNVTEIEEAREYFSYAKELGLQISSNLMKSYAVSIDEFIRFAKKADDYGADTITVVDSAGGMFPYDVREYVRRLKDITDRDIGFHGHNNLQLALANTLEAVNSGATVVDSSIQGMGRSAGNAQTEVLVMALEKLGYNTGIDPYITLDLGERVIKPMMSQSQGIDDMSIISGIAQFHSSFSEIIADSASRYGVDPRLLIMEVSKIDRINVTPELADNTAKNIKEKYLQNSGSNLPTIITEYLKWEKPKSILEKTKTISGEMNSRSKKTGKESVFSFTLSSNQRTNFPFIRENPSMVIGNCEACNIKELKEILQFVDGKVDWILADESCKRLRDSNIERRVKKSSFAWYSEERALRLSLCSLVFQKKPPGKILLFCDLDNSVLIKSSLAKHGLEVIRFEKDHLSDQIGDVKAFLQELGGIISFGKDFSLWLQADHIEFLKNEIHLIATRPNSFPDPFWKMALNKGLQMYRVDTRIGFSTELALSIETTKLITLMGLGEIDGIPIVSGGVIAPKGTVIVDSVNEPSMVIGTTDGFGGLLHDDEDRYKDDILRVKAKIIESRYRKEF